MVLTKINKISLLINLKEWKQKEFIMKIFKATKYLI
jgi:hypothetical protein